MLYIQLCGEYTQGARPVSIFHDYCYESLENANIRDSWIFLIF